jgi:putative addiction module component (TIGR02574 family)
MTRDQIIQNVKSLPKDQQIDLALELWESIEAASADPPLSEQQRRELDRRVASDAADPQPDEPWDDLRRKLLKGEI